MQRPSKHKAVGSSPSNDMEPPVEKEKEAKVQSGSRSFNLHGIQIQFGKKLKGESAFSNTNNEPMRGPTSLAKQLEEQIKLFDARYQTDVLELIKKVRRVVLNTYTDNHKETTEWEQDKYRQSCNNKEVFIQLRAIMARLGKYQSYSAQDLRLRWKEVLKDMKEDLKLQIIGGAILQLYPEHTIKFREDGFGLYLDDIDQRRVIVQIQELWQLANLIIQGCQGVNLEITFRYFQPENIDIHMKKIEKQIEEINRKLAGKFGPSITVKVSFIHGNANEEKKERVTIKELLVGYFDSEQRSDFLFDKKQVPGKIVVIYRQPQ